ncbi:oxygen-binding di-iron domain-containing protein [Parafrankia elaeagni]|uniref:hypothetical protein n=1 Tax=Parafrankia elaeagni TaxID=222534 RepID=UPI000379B8C8|nr:hypothetical protein [Parafrankia elaeagni]
MTTTHEIAPGIHRISTYVPDVGPRGFTFNQFLIEADEPLIYHTGMHALFGAVSEAVARIVPLSELRWIASGHFEADECGAMNDFLAVAPAAQVVHSTIGVLTSFGDAAARPPRALADGEELDLGGAGNAAGRRRVRHLDTPHVPHNWESRMLFETETGTLFCGDLGAQDGNPAALTSDSVVDAAMRTEELFRSSSLGPAVPATLRRLADLNPTTLAIMHGSSFHGDGAGLLRALADAYETTFPQTRAVAEPSHAA